MATSSSRGHKTTYNGSAWVYCDTGDVVNDDRPCIRCGKPPVDGMDACTGHVEGAVSACCGHGVTESILMEEWESKHYRPHPSRLSIVKYIYHKDETYSWAIICDDGKVLCQGIREYPYMIFHPILWDYKKAEKWIEKGYIGNLQEGLSNLAVGFEGRHVAEL